MRSIRWLAVLPFLGLIVGPFFVNRATPFIAGSQFFVMFDRVLHTNDTLRPPTRPRSETTVRLQISKTQQ